MLLELVVEVEFEAGVAEELDEDEVVLPEVIEAVVLPLLLDPVEDAEDDTEEALPARVNMTL